MTTPTQPTPDSSSTRAAAPAPKPGKFAGVAVMLVGLLIVGGAVTATVLLSGSAGGSKSTDRGAAAADPAVIAAGKQLAGRHGCTGCHSDDGSINRGPTWKGMYGSVVTYDDGSQGVIDEAAIREALERPTERIIEGYEGIMPPVRNLPEADVKSLIAYMESMGVDAR